MRPYILCLWLSGVLLESLLLVRALSRGWFKNYPLFFAYIACVLTQDVFFLVIYRTRFEYYTMAYWCGEFFSVALGVAVTYEIFSLTLGRYPGASRMARQALWVLLVLCLCKPLADALNGNWSWSITFVELERNVRSMQALSLLVLALLVGYYRIALGRNTLGIFVGYGIFIGESVITLSLRSALGVPFQNAWEILQPIFYMFALGIWCALLWRYEPRPAVLREAKIEDDYKSLVAATRKSLLQARTFWGKATRP